MGAEAKCVATIGRKHVEGKALLETDSLIFRGGDVRLNIPFVNLRTLKVRDGVLYVDAGDGVVKFGLGSAAAKWAEKITHPPSRADKLGVKEGQSVLLLNIEDDDLASELTIRGATFRAGTPLDVIFYGVKTRAALTRVPKLRDSLASNGALWIVRPKGSPDVSEADVMKAGRSAGLVDVKVVRFSETHTAEKFVVPVAKR